MTERITEIKHSKLKKLGKASIAGAGVLAVASVLSGLHIEGAKPAFAADPSNSPVSLAGSESPSASEAPSNSKIYPLGNNEKMAVMPGDVIAGDVAMSDTDGGSIKVLYDTDTNKASDVADNAKSALYVFVDAPGEVYAPYGATVTTGMTDAEKQVYMQLQNAEKQAAGFTKVDSVHWTGYDSTIDEAHLSAVSNPTPTPSEAPASETPTPSIYEVTPDNDAFLKQVLAMDLNDSSLNLTLDQKLAIEQVKLDYANEQIDEALLKELQDCGCMPPCPTPSASPTPTPSETPCVPEEDHVMKAGDVLNIAKGKRAIVQGDVWIQRDNGNWVRHYDNSENTGAIDELLDTSSNYKIRALFGADVQEFNSCATASDISTWYTKDLEALNNTNRSLDSNSVVIK